MKTLIKEQAKLERRFIRLIMKLPPEQVLGVTTILGVPLVEDSIEEDIIENTTENIVVENEIAADSIDQNKEVPEEKEELKKSNEDNEDKKDNARDAMTILFEALEKFKALNLHQKKNLIKIMKAGV